MNANQNVTSTSSSNNLQESITNLLRHGDESYSTAHYENALNKYKECLKMIESCSPQDNLEISKLLTRIGNTLESKGDFDAALDTFYKCLVKHKAKEIDYANTLRNIGSVYERKENFDMAMEYFNQSLVIQQSISPSNYFKLIYDLDYSLPKYDQAFDTFKRRIPLIHPDIAITLNKIGLVYFKRKDFVFALAKFKEAMNILKKTLPHQHPLVATTIVFQGKVFQARKEFEKALEFYKEAMDIFNSVMSMNHPSKAALNKIMAEIYLEKGFIFYDEALAAVTKSIDYFHSGNFRLDSPVAQDTIKLRKRIEEKKEDINNSMIGFCITLAFAFLFYYYKTIVVSNDI